MVIGVLRLDLGFGVFECCLRDRSFACSSRYNFVDGFKSVFVLLMCFIIVLVVVVVVLGLFWDDCEFLLLFVFFLVVFFVFVFVVDVFCTFVFIV